MIFKSRVVEHLYKFGKVTKKPATRTRGGLSSNYFMPKILVYFLKIPAFAGMTG